MAKVKVTGLNRVQKRLQKILVGALAGKEEVQQIKESVVNTLRSGKLLDGSNIKGLKPGTVEQRRRLATVNRTGKGYSPGKSNLTFTGQFLKSFVASIERGARGIIIKVSPSGIHRGYKRLRGGRGKATTNQKIAAGQKAQGRDITAIGPKKSKEIRNIFVRLLRRSIRRN